MKGEWAGVTGGGLSLLNRVNLIILEILFRQNRNVCAFMLRELYLLLIQSL